MNQDEIEADIISEWKNGRYNNFIKNSDGIFGFKYPIDTHKGYFIRVIGNYKDEKWRL